MRPAAQKPTASTGPGGEETAPPNRKDLVMTATDVMPAPDVTLAPMPRGGGEQTTTSTTKGDLSAVLATMLGVDVAGIFDQMEWADDEIQKATRRHPRHTEQIDHSFPLLRPNSDLERMNSEMVYRAHCSELLDRVAAGEDTRPGTAAEVCCAMLDTSLRTPITSEATGLYMRMWLAAGFPDIADVGEASRHHEALEPSRIDAAEQEARHKLAMPDRR